jgi:hypothetical protein
LGKIAQIKEACMKRLILVTLAVLCAAAFVPPNLEAGVGIKAGYSLSKFSVVSVDPVPTFDYLKFYTGGIFFDIKLGFVSVQPEILYARMGANIESDTTRLEYRLEYIQAPVLLKLNIVPVGPIRPFLYAGGYGSYLYKASGITWIDGVMDGDPVDLKDTYQKYDYGVVGGGGLAFKLPGISISIEGRYNYGLMNILKDPAEGEATKNRSIMALVGIGF